MLRTLHSSNEKETSINSLVNRNFYSSPSIGVQLLHLCTLQNNVVACGRALPA